MTNSKICFAMCGSFCTVKTCTKQMEKLANDGYDILPVMSFNLFELDTKFGKAQETINEVEKICKKSVIHTLTAAEPIGPQKLADILLVAPCTGNTLAKICRGISDTPVTLAVKSQLRIRRPVVIALASNDALGASAQNLGKVLNYKNIYFVPMSQDDCINKPTSLVAHFDLISETIECAFNSKQIQPIFLNKGQ